MKRIDEIVVTVLVREYGEDGLPIGEQQSQPLKLFRAVTPNVWARLDAELALTEKE